MAANSDLGLEDTSLGQGHGVTRRGCHHEHPSHAASLIPDGISGTSPGFVAIPGPG